MNEDREVIVNWYAGQVAALKFFEAVGKNANTNLDPGVVALIIMKSIDKEELHGNLENNGILPELEPYITEYKLRDCYEGLKGSESLLSPSMKYLVDKIEELHPQFKIPEGSRSTSEAACGSLYDEYVASHRDYVSEYVSIGQSLGSGY